MKFFSIVIMMFVAIGIADADADTDTLNVPSQYSTIQGAIEAAVNGDTVLVAPGTYMENLDFKGKAIIVKSSGSNTDTIIDGGSLGEVVVFHSLETRSSVLDGFTITNSAGPAIGIGPAGPTIRNNLIRDNPKGSGVYSDSQHFRSLIESNIIENNKYGVFSRSPIEINDNTISNNKRHGVRLSGANDSIISGNSIFGNQDSGIYCRDSIECSIENNFIFDNTDTAELGGGGIRCDHCSPDIYNNVISNNFSMYRGGGIFLSKHSSSRVCNNLIWNNGSHIGGGIATKEYSFADFYHNTIVNNHALLRGGAFSFENYSVFNEDCTLLNCIIWGNTAPSGATIFLNNSSKVLVEYCDLEGRLENILNHSGYIMLYHGVIDADPLFVDASSGDFRLSQDPCQPGIVNPCVDSGSQEAIYLNMQNASTRTDSGLDEGIVDMGWHSGPYHPIQFRSDQDTLSASSGGKVEMFLKGGTRNINRHYLILASATGMSPGYPLPGGEVVLPLNWDIVTDICLSLVNTPVCKSFMGRLSSHGGYGWATLDTGPLPGAAGKNIHFAFVLKYPYDFVSNPVRLKIVP